MKIYLHFFAIVLISFSGTSCRNLNKAKLIKEANISEFLGQWTIDIEGGSVGWLEVRQNDNFLDGDILWGGGSVVPVSNIFLANRQTLVVARSNDVIRRKDESNKPIKTQVVTSWLEITRKNEKIVGILLSPHINGLGLDTIKFTGTKLPPLSSPPNLSKVNFGTPITLFNGKDLAGWKLINEKKKNGFSVVNGVLESNPLQTEGTPHISYGNLRTNQVFNDFNLKLEVKVAEKSNSGIYLRGMYEIQVVDSYKKGLNSHHMGAVYSRITPNTNAEKPAGVWQTFDITLCDRYVTVVLNGIKIIDNQPIYGPTGGAIISDVFSAGPIYLQGDEGGIVDYRNIILTPIMM